ncbi:hypothetical protein J0H33_10155 [bacterium]|nr:hypothetical protein [bacterium]
MLPAAPVSTVNVTRECAGTGILSFPSVGAVKVCETSFGSTWLSTVALPALLGAPAEMGCTLIVPPTVPVTFANMGVGSGVASSKFVMTNVTLLCAGMVRSAGM